jgi:hypothetical protein
VSRKSKAKPALLDERAQAKLRAALHEAGHFIAAKHYNVAEVSGLHRVGNAGHFTGKTIYSPTSAFNEAVIGWAGALAETMLGKTPTQWETDCKTVWEMFTENQLTKNDSDLINRHADARKTFAQAVKILLDNFDETRQAAVNLFNQDSLFNFP